MARPYFETRKNQAMPTIIAAETTMLMTYTVWSCNPSTFTTWVWKIFGNGCRLTPKIHFINAENTVDNAIVTMITEMMGSPIIGRRITTWMAMPNRNMKTSVIGIP